MLENVQKLPEVLDSSLSQNAKPKATRALKSKQGIVIVVVVKFNR